MSEKNPKIESLKETNIQSTLKNQKTKSELVSTSNPQNQFWWNNIKDVEENQNFKWRELEHNGVLFPNINKSNSLYIIYKDKKIPLNTDLEQIVINWV